MGARKIQKGAWNAINVCLRVKPSDSILIICDINCRAVGIALKDEAIKVTNSVKYVELEAFGKRSMNGNNPLLFPKDLENALSRSTVSIFAARQYPGERKSFRGPMMEAIKRYKVKHAHMPGVNEQMMMEGMSVDYQRMGRLATSLLEQLHGIKKLHVTSPAGSDLMVEFGPPMKWAAATGIAGEYDFINLPEGEVATTPKNIYGKAVIDGSIGDYFTDKYGLIDKQPIAFSIEDGYCDLSTITSANTALQEDLVRFLKKEVENINRVGEFSFGINFGITSIIGNALQDEKKPGIHFALGDSYPSFTNAPWSCEGYHVDFIMQKPTVLTMDGRHLMKDGSYNIRV